MRSFTLLILLFLFNNQSFSAYQPVTVTGFNADVVANGIGSASTSITANADGGSPGFALLAPDFKALAGNAAPTYALPANGLINSANTSGLSFQLSDYASSNALRLTGTGNGTITLGSPVYANEIYLLTLSGSGASTITVTVTFSDASTQVFTGVSVSDWFGGTGFAIQGIGRVQISNDALGADATNPRLYETKLTINTANYSKQITSINVAKTNTTGGATVLVMAVSVNTLTACSTPAAQATSLSLSPTLYNIAGAYSAASPTADKYLVVRTPGNTSPSVAPVTGTLYTAGNTLGNATVIYAGTATTFNDAGVTGNTTYTYTVYAYNDVGCYNPAYNTTTPLTGSATTPSCAPVAGGTYKIGPSPTDHYTSLTAAFNSIYGGGGATGNIILQLQPDYLSTVETFPLSIPNISTGPCSVNNPTCIIRPAPTASGLEITSTDPVATIDFNGARRVVIDGRAGGTGTNLELSISNTSTTGVAIRFINDAQGDTVRYCDIQGQNTTSPATGAVTSAGVIYFSTASATTLQGNDNNVIDFCEIHSVGGPTPAVGIFSIGTTTSVASYNDNNTISNCNIYDYFHATAASTGIKLDAGNNAWTITGNSLYQQNTRTVTGTAGTQRALWLTPNTASINNTASGFTISGNYIGGIMPSAGASPMTYEGTVSYAIYGMDISVGLGAATSIQNNTITNISYTSAQTSLGFAGISIANGNVDVGTVTGNTIGAETGNGAIVINATGSAATHWGVRIGSGNIINVANNKIGAINAGGTGAISTSFIGVGTAGGTTINVTNNTISNIVMGPSTSATAQSVTGISVVNGTTSSISGNRVIGLTNNYTGTGAGLTRGIVLTTGASSITNNVVQNLYSSGATTGSGASCAIVGIAMSSTNAAGCNVTGNVIDSLVLGAVSTTSAIQATGIFYSGTSSVVSSISRNFIHSFDVMAANPNVVFTGLDFASATAIIANNMIRLGIKPDGASVLNGNTFRGISSNSGSANNSIYFNSIYIGGTNVNNTAKPSYAFIRTSTSGTYDVRNNIFVNERSNSSSGGGKHYAVYFTTNVTGISPNYNLYRATGTDGVMAFNGTADVTSYSSGWIAGDANSITANPNFVNAGGTVNTVDLHIAPVAHSPVESTGVLIAGITDDFDGQSRSALSPTDIGADAGYFSILPVSLLSFKGIKEGSINLLQWSTASEINNAGFELERSIDGMKFSKIAFVASKAADGNSNMLLSYAAIDAKPFAENNYYRLKQLDKDGQFTYSTVVLIKGDKPEGIRFSAYPNPVKEKLDVLISANRSEDATVVITALNGLIIKQTPVRLMTGDNKLALNVGSLPAGSYVLTIVTPQGISSGYTFIRQ